jgi:tetratricopeptide (TPR) repeat protein/DNA-binding winged helix-turn-helix (wHTH) protein/TolB-like protein
VHNSGPHCYRVGDVEVDRLSGCIRTPEGEVYVRPKSLQVLIYLIENRDRLVTKAELIDNFWQDTAVTDDALVQKIKEIRKLLGDDPQRPRFIKTYPRAGYRFISPVEALSKDSPVPNRPMIVTTRETTSLEIDLEEDLTQPFHSESALGESLTGSLPARRKDRLVATYALTLALIAVISISALVIYRSMLTALPRPDIHLTERQGGTAIAVMYFENQSGSRDLDWLREGLADMLITGLGRSKTFSVLSRQQLSVMLNRSRHQDNDPIGLSQALSIAGQSGARVVVLGSFAKLGDRIRIDVRLHDQNSGRVIATDGVIVDKPDQVFSQVDLLSLKLASNLGVADIAEDTRNGLSDSMTSSLEAYRYYSMALERADAFHTEEAIDLWKKAIELDPQFAMAYARLGYTYTMVRVNEPDKAKPFLEKAFQLSDRLAEKEKLYIKAWYAFAVGDVQGTFQAFREIIKRYPRGVEAYTRLGYMCIHNGRLEEASEVLRQALVIDPEGRDIYNQLGFAYYNLGKLDEAVDAHQRYVQLAPQEPNAHDSLGMSYAASGRYDDALLEFDRALALNPAFHFGSLHKADIHFLLGHYQAAALQYQQYLKVAPSDWDRAVGYHSLYWLYQRKGDLNRAEQAARQELRLGSDFGDSLLIALARGDLGSAEKFREQLFAHPVFDRNFRPVTVAGQKTLEYCLGYYTLKTGHTPEAIEHFKEAIGSGVHWNVYSVEDCLAGAYLNLGRIDEAIAEYERLRNLFPNSALTHYHLGEACERKADLDHARSEYQAFLQIWKDADPDLKEVVAAKRYLSSHP